MTSAVLDASAVLTLIHSEARSDKVAQHIGQAAISAVTLHELIKQLLLSELDEPTVREVLGELRLDVRDHDTEAADAAAALHVQTKQFGRGLGDRSCMALALQLGLPAITADKEWGKFKGKSMKIEQIR